MSGAVTVPSLIVMTSIVSDKSLKTLKTKKEVKENDSWLSRSCVPVPLSVACDSTWLLRCMPDWLASPLVKR